MNSSFINNDEDDEAKRKRRKRRKKKNYINVTAAIIEKNREILIARRNRDQSHPEKWEFPGGKIEPGETPKVCLRRELFEELDIRILVGKRFLVFEYNYGRQDRRIHRFFSFLCKILAGEPRLKVHDAFAWVRIEELSGFDFIEADKQLVSTLLADRIR